MMGSSRPSDPTLSAASDFVGLVRAFGSKGADAVIERIEAATKAAIAEIETAQKRLVEDRESLKLDSDTLDQAIQEHNDRDKELIKRENDLAKAQADLSQKHEKILGTEAKVKADIDTSVKLREVLDRDTANLAKVHTDRMRYLEDEHGRRTTEHHEAVVKFDERVRDTEASLSARDAEVEAKIRDHSAAIKEFIEKSAQLKQDRQSVDAMKELYEAKLAKLNEHLLALAG